MLPWLLLGDARRAGDKEALAQAGVTHVLNVAGKEGRVLGQFAALGIAYKEIPGEDDEDFPMLPCHLAEVPHLPS